jgi:hypothetical protein
MKDMVVDIVLIQAVQVVFVLLQRVEWNVILGQSVVQISLNKIVFTVVQICVGDPVRMLSSLHPPVMLI